MFCLIFTIIVHLTILPGRAYALLNSVQKIIEIQGWLFLTLFMNYVFQTIMELKELN